MARIRKLPLSNLNEFRSDLGLTQEDFAKAIFPMTRQTVINIEKQTPKNVKFLEECFKRMEKAFGDRYEELNLVEEKGDVPRFTIHFQRRKSFVSNQDKTIENCDVDEAIVLVSYFLSESGKLISTACEFENRQFLDRIKVPICNFMELISEKGLDEYDQI